MPHCFLVKFLGDTGQLQHVAVSITVKGELTVDLCLSVSGWRLALTHPLYPPPYPPLSHLSPHLLPSKSELLSAHSPQLPALSTSCDPPVWSFHLSSSSSSSHPFCTSPSSYCTVSSTHSVAWTRWDRRDRERERESKKRERRDEMRRIFRQSYSTAQGLILEMYKEAWHESAPGRKCTSDLDDKTSLWCFSALVCTVWQWTKHPSAYISSNEKCVCYEKSKWHSFSQSKLYEGRFVRQAAWGGEWVPSLSLIHPT